VLPVYEELGAASNTVVVQFDAHLDIQNFDACTKEPSHGNFLLHAEGPLPTVINIGHRDLLLQPDHVRNFYSRAISAAELANRFPEVLEEVATYCRSAERVFLDLDCDVFDPACFPAVTHPVPFGLQPRDVLLIVDAVWSEKVAGVAISEFDPARDRNDECLATLAWLLEYILLRRHE
jgi:arginase family enzyme